MIYFNNVIAKLNIKGLILYAVVLHDYNVFYTYSKPFFGRFYINAMHNNKATLKNDHFNAARLTRRM